LTLEPGAKLGPYEVLSLLGAGGMGEVYRARDARVDRAVALKVLPEEFFGSEERTARFEREAKLLASLNHPGIATLYSFEEIPGSSTSDSAKRHVLVMELLEGETLRERLRAGPLPPRKAIDAAAQVAKGLAAAHEKGIVHRDLKPENVFLTKGDRVKILDFGLAKSDRRTEGAGEVTSTPTESLLTEAGSVIGTVGYMSPEQVCGEPVDFRSDLFSFGTVLHEMLSGRNPFRRGTQAETMTAILREEPEPFSGKAVGIAPALSSIVGRCLEKEPELRFHSAADLAFALETLAQASSQEAVPPQKRAVSRPRRALVLAGALAVLGAAVAGAFLAGKRAGLTPTPVFNRLTFRRGSVEAARFAPDGQTFIYTAMWEGTPVQLYSARKENPETTALGSPEALLLGVSSTGELALSLNPRYMGALGWLGTLARAPPGGGAPREVVNDVQEADWLPDGSSLAAVRFFAGKPRLEFPLGTTLLELPGRLAQPRISRDGRLLAFLEFPSFAGQGSVAVIDREGRKRNLSSGWAMARGLAWSPAGDEVWFTASKSGGAFSLRAVSLSGRERAVGGAWGRSWILHDVAPDGRALMTSGVGQTSMIGITPSRERDLSWLGGSVACDISADGSLVLFNESGDAVGNRPVAFVRGMDGSPAVRLGEGKAVALSPDKRWALVYRGVPAPSLVLVPMGAGEEKILPRGTIAEYEAARSSFTAAFFPDGKHLIFRGMESGKARRLFVQDLEGGLPRPFGEDLLSSPLVSPDGRWIATEKDTGEEVALLVFTADGAPVHRVAIERGDALIRWGEESRSVFVRQRRGMTMVISRLELPSGRRQVWREINSQDPAGLLRGTGLGSGSFYVNITPDGKFFVSTYTRSISDLYLVEGLK